MNIENMTKLDLEILLEKQLKLLNSSLKRKLPDGGAKLQKNIEAIRARLSNLLSNDFHPNVETVKVVSTPLKEKEESSVIVNEIKPLIETESSNAIDTSPVNDNATQNSSMERPSVAKCAKIDIELEKMKWMDESIAMDSRNDICLQQESHTRDFHFSQQEDEIRELENKMKSLSIERSTRSRKSKEYDAQAKLLLYGRRGFDNRVVKKSTIILSLEEQNNPKDFEEASEKEEKEAFQSTFSSLSLEVNHSSNNDNDDDNNSDHINEEKDKLE